jgi:hypothetical protein
MAGNPFSPSSSPAFREGICVGCGERVPLNMIRVEDIVLDNGKLPHGYCDACARDLAAILIARMKRRA